MPFLLNCALEYAIKKDQAKEGTESGCFISTSGICWWYLVGVNINTIMSNIEAAAFSSKEVLLQVFTA